MEDNGQNIACDENGNKNEDAAAGNVQTTNPGDIQKSKSLMRKVYFFSWSMLLLVVLNIFSIIAYCIWKNGIFIFTWILSIPLFFVSVSSVGKYNNEYRAITGQPITERNGKDNPEQESPANDEVYCTKSDIENLLKEISRSDKCPICKANGKDTDIIKEDYILSKTVREKEDVAGVYTGVSSLGQVHQAYQYVNRSKTFPAVKYHCPVCGYDCYVGTAKSWVFDGLDNELCSLSVKQLKKGKLSTAAYERFMKGQDKLIKEEKWYACIDENASFIKKMF